MAKEITFQTAIPEFLKHLTEQGKNERTIGVYGRCLASVAAYFGNEKPLGKLTPATIGTFYKSDAFLKKTNGDIKNPITQTQNRRVFRLMLVWACEIGLLSDNPLPKAELKKGRTHDANADHGGDA